MSYVASDTPSESDFDDAVTLTCGHVEDVLVKTFDSDFVILEQALCTPVFQSTNPVQIRYETFVIFAKESVAFPDEASINAVIQTAFEEPNDEELILDLNGLPVTNPFSTTSEVTYGVARRVLFETIPASSSRALNFLLVPILSLMMIACGLLVRAT